MSFDCQPRLRSELLYLRALQVDDFDALYAVSSDPLLWEQTPYQDRCQLAVYQQWFDAAILDKALIVLDMGTKAVIGSSRYYEIDESNSEVVIGHTFLARDYWGGLTNKDLKRLMLKHAFQSFETVWLQIAEGNVRSRKAAEKIGAVLIRKGDKNGLPYCWYKLQRSVECNE